MVASGVFAGAFTLEEAHAIRAADGKTMGEELRRIGYAGDAAVGGRPVGAYFELHIQQGPILERQGKPIGIVTRPQGPHWYGEKVTGEGGNAGTPPTALPNNTHET